MIGTKPTYHSSQEPLSLVALGINIHHVGFIVCKGCFYMLSFRALFKTICSALQREKGLLFLLDDKSYMLKSGI